MSPEAFVERREQTPENSALVNALRVVRERWLIVAATFVVGLVVAFAVSKSQTKQYSATAQLLVQPSNLPALVDASQTQAQDSTQQQRTQSDDVSAVTSSAVAALARAQLHTIEPSGSLAGRVSASADTTNDLIDIEATDPDAGRAARIANAFASSTVTYLTESAQQQIAAGQAKLQAELAALGANDPGRPQLEQALREVIALRAVTNGGVRVQESATTPSSPSSPSVKRDTVLGAVIGLVVGLAAIFLLDLFDRRIKTVESLERRYGLSALSTIPLRRRRAPGGRLGQVELEPFRILRDGLAHVSLQQDPRVVLVTSATAGEGKTGVATGLGQAMAAAGRRVLLVETDVHRPSVRGELGLPTHPTVGLMNRLVGGAEDAAIISHVPEVANLSVIGCGPFTPNSAELLRLPAMTELLQRLAAQFDFVILDGAPLLPVADSQVLLDNPTIDVVVLVARPNVTTRDQIRLTRNVLARHASKGLGLVVNGVREKARGYGEYARGHRSDSRPLDTSRLTADGSPPRHTEPNQAEEADLAARRR